MLLRRVSMIRMLAVTTMAVGVSVAASGPAFALGIIFNQAVGAPTVVHPGASACGCCVVSDRHDQYIHDRADHLLEDRGR